MPSADVAVLGLGAAGSAILEALARRGVKAVGLDQHHPPHIHGSTHGRSRLIREAYFESPLYVPLLQLAYREWDRLQRESGRPLLTRTGGIMIGPPDSELVQGARTSAGLHALPHEVLDSAEIRRRFPVFAVTQGDVGVVEPRAGFLDPEACVTACLDLAERAGATILRDTTVTGWKAGGNGVRLTTSAGDLDCGRLVLAAGPWLPGLLQGFPLPLTIERQVMYWFTPRAHAERFQPSQCPIFIWEHAPGRMFYGAPDHGFGFKAAMHHEGALTSPGSVDRAVSAPEITAMRDLLSRTIPDAEGELRDAMTCLYTNTPDHHFILGPHPAESRVYLASPCSGHGFKLASAVGQVVADEVLEGGSGFDLTIFRPTRF